MRHGPTYILATLAIAAALAVVSSCDDVDAIADADWTIDAFANPATITVPSGQSGTSVITAVVLDESGIPQAGIGVRFTTDAGSLASGGSFIETNSRGEAQDTLTTSADATVTASSGTLSAMVDVFVDSSGGPAAVLDVSPENEQLVGMPVTFSGENSSDAATYRFTVVAPVDGVLTQDGTAPLFTVPQGFSAAQVLDVTLRVANAAGVSDVTSGTYDIVTMLTNLAPTAIVTPLILNVMNPTPAPSYNCTGEIDACGSSDPDGMITAFRVDWGDLTPAEDVFVATDPSACMLTHDYAAPMTSPGYSVTVTAYDDGKDPGSATCTSPTMTADLLAAACPSRLSDDSSVSIICPVA